MLFQDSPFPPREREKVILASGSLERKSLRGKSTFAAEIIFDPMTHRAEDTSDFLFLETEGRWLLGSIEEFNFTLKNGTKLDLKDARNTYKGIVEL